MSWTLTSTFYFLLLLEFQRHRIDAVTEACRIGAIVEDVAEVGSATTAKHFGAMHKESIVIFRAHVLCCDGLPETWPAGAGIELVL